MMDGESHERRRHARHKVSVAAMLLFPSSCTERGTVTVDLSQEGAQFGSPKAVQPGDPVFVRLLLQQHTFPVECESRVCWCRPVADGVYSFGVHFTELEDENRQRLNAFLEEMALRSQ